MKKIIITVSIILCFVVGALLYIQHKHTSNLLVVEKNNSTSKNKKQEKKKDCENYIFHSPLPLLYSVDSFTTFNTSSITSFVSCVFILFFSFMDNAFSA